MFGFKANFISTNRSGFQKLQTSHLFQKASFKTFYEGPVWQNPVCRNGRNCVQCNSEILSNNLNLQNVVLDPNGGCQKKSLKMSPVISSKRQRSLWSLHQKRFWILQNLYTSRISPMIWKIATVMDCMLVVISICTSHFQENVFIRDRRKTWNTSKCI